MTGIGTDEGTATVGNRVILKYKVVVSAGTHINEISSIGAIGNDIALEDDVLYIRRSLTGIVVQSLGTM